MAQRTFYTLQAGRGIAATMVVLYHLNGHIFGLAKYWPAKFSPIFSFGHAGVEFFFVLSGFIITYVHWNQIGDGKSFGSFVRKRFVRIYPIYWVILALLLPIYFLSPSFRRGYEPDLFSVLTSITLLPSPNPPALGVAWTLQHEVLFYGVFAVAVLNARLGAILATLWLAPSLILFAVEPGFWLPTFLFAPLHLLFLFGVGVAYYVRNRRVPMPALMTGLGLAVFFGTGLGEIHVGRHHPYALSILYGIGAATAALGLIEMERSGRLSVPYPLRLLGDASYSLYLVHFPTLSVCAKLWFAVGLGRMLPDWVSFVALLAIALSAGIALYRFVERPLIGALSSSRRVRRGGRDPDAAGARP